MNNIGDEFKDLDFKPSLHEIDPDGDIDDFNGKDQEYVFINQAGVRKYREIQKSSVMKFMFWCGVGLIGGVGSSSLIKHLPFKDGLTLTKAKKYRMWSFVSISLPCTYHGFALARRDFRQGRKSLLDNPEYSSVDIS